jgi:hypothetical protein
MGSVSERFESGATAQCVGEIPREQILDSVDRMIADVLE